MCNIWFVTRKHDTTAGHSVNCDPLILNRLPPEVCDGFSTLLFPVLQHRHNVTCKLSRREYQETFTDLKVVVQGSVADKNSPSQFQGYQSKILKENRASDSNTLGPAGCANKKHPYSKDCSSRQKASMGSTSGGDDVKMNAAAKKSKSVQDMPFRRVFAV